MRTNFLWAKLLLTMLVVLSVSSIYADCKLMGLISFNQYDMNDFVVPSTDIWNFTYNCLIGLQIQGGNYEAYYPNNNPDGWGMVEYEKNSKHLISYNIDNNEQTDGLIWKNQDPASVGNGATMYNNVVSRLHNTITTSRTLYPHIVLGHVRKATSGPTDIADPHPFIFETPERDYTFIHNGGVKTEALYENETNMCDLINNADPTWISHYPITTATTQYPYGVDSEWFFSFVMLKITQNNNNIVEGIKAAIHEMLANNVIVSNSAINFILSDGVDLYTYRKLASPDTDMYHPLAYFYIPNASLSKCYAGVMSIFPTSVPSVGVRQILDDELIYMSKTGNIVKFQNFSEQGDEVLTYVRAFHANLNWSSFPVMEGSETIITPFVQPLVDEGGLHQIFYNNDETSNDYIPNQPGWEIPEQMLANSSLYKLDFNGPTMPITSGGFLEKGALRSSQESILTDIQPWQDYWIGYHLLPSQNIKEAFGDSWDNVASVKAETWFYKRAPEIQTKQGNSAQPVIAWSTYNKSMEFGKGYIVTFRSSQPSFAWENPHHIDLRELYAVSPEKPEYFEFEYKPEYLAIDIMDADDPVNVLEIGAYQGFKCIGAVKPESLPCQLLVYPDWSDTTSITFEVVWKEMKSMTYIDQFQVWDQDVHDFIPGNLDTSVQYCQIKLSGSSGNLNNHVIPVISMQNAPNPILDNTRLMVKLSTDAKFSLTIYNIKGQRVNEVFHGSRKAGKHAFLWSGKDESGIRVSSGIYFARLKYGKQIVTNKMLVLK